MCGGGGHCEDVSTIDSAPYGHHMARVRSHQALVAVERMMMYGLRHVRYIHLRCYRSFFMLLALYVIAESFSCSHAAPVLQETFLSGLKYQCRGSALKRMAVHP